MSDHAAAQDRSGQALRVLLFALVCPSTIPGAPHTPAASNHPQSSIISSFDSRLIRGEKWRAERGGGHWTPARTMARPHPNLGRPLRATTRRRQHCFCCCHPPLLAPLPSLLPTSTPLPYPHLLQPCVSSLSFLPHFLASTLSIVSHPSIFTSFLRFCATMSSYGLSLSMFYAPVLSCSSLFAPCSRCHIIPLLLPYSTLKLLHIYYVSAPRPPLYCLPPCSLLLVPPSSLNEYSLPSMDTRAVLTPFHACHVAPYICFLPPFSSLLPYPPPPVTALPSRSSLLATLPHTFPVPPPFPLLPFFRLTPFDNFPRHYLFSV